MYRYLLFDLDGTLTDSGRGIMNSAAYALKKYGIVINDILELRRFVGPPLKNSFMEFYGFSEEKSREAVEYYREYYRDNGIFENEVYDSIPELLSALKEKGMILSVATSKAEVFTERVLDHFGLDRYFDYISASALDGTGSDKKTLIANVINKFSITDKSRMLMIGDRKFDIIGAKLHGIDSVGVLYGYGSMEELSEAGASFTVSSPMEILELL